MTTPLSDLFREMFPTPPPELLARLTALDALPLAVTALDTDAADMRVAVTALGTAIATLTGTIDTDVNEIFARLHTLADTVARLDAQLNPQPDTVTIGPATRVASTLLGWTSVHQQTRNAQTAAILARTSNIQNQHLLGFGAGTNPQPGPGAAYDWRFMDATFGPNGYFADAPNQCLTACGCPPHMRTPKPGTTPDPMGPATGTALTSLSEYTFPHSSWWPEYAQLIAALVVHCPTITHLQVWNENKGLWIGNVYPGSRLSPVGSGLVSIPGGNRYWAEGYTYFFNLIWRAVKAVRPDIKIVGNYQVLNSYAWEFPGDWAPDLAGPWGHADRKALDPLRYFLAHCDGTDAVCFDIRNTTKDWNVTNYFTGTTPDPGNKWLTNPDGGAHGTYLPAGAWGGCDKLADVAQWVHDATVADDTVWLAEFYSNATNSYPGNNPATGQPYGDTRATPQNEAAMFARHYLVALQVGAACAMCWKPQGPEGRSNPLGLWNDQLTETALVPVCEGFVTHFAPGAQLYDVTADNPDIRGVATDTTLCLINQTDQPVDVRHAGTPITLAPYDVRFVPR